MNNCFLGISPLLFCACAIAPPDAKGNPLHRRSYDELSDETHARSLSTTDMRNRRQAYPTLHCPTRCLFLASQPRVMPFPAHRPERSLKQAIDKAVKSHRSYAQSLLLQNPCPITIEHR